MAIPTILFVADAVTLAHVVRPLALARQLDTGRFRVLLACDPRYGAFLEGLPFPILPLRSQPSEHFLEAAAKGRPLYDLRTLRAYVRDDLDLLASVRPDAVIGDHRLSLSVSARVAGVPYLAITNAYWSPYAEHAYPLPDLPMNRWLGIGPAQMLFRMTCPLAFAYHSIPLNRLHREHGLPSPGWDWRRPYAAADRTLYADAEELIPTFGRPPSHAYLGPVSWSPNMELPTWWNDLPADRPLIYATLGSSGPAGLLARVLEALADMPVMVVASTAGRDEGIRVPDNTRLLAFAPGDKLAARADMLICNGGSLSAYQALAAGKPLIGIAAHMDQHLSMRYVEKAGVGLKLRSDRLETQAIKQAVQRLLSDAGARARAGTLAQAIATYNPAQRLTAILNEVLPHGLH